MISADIYYSYLELVSRQIDVFKLPAIWSPFSEEEENTWGWWCCDPYAECWHIVPTLIGKNQKATTKCQKKPKPAKNFTSNWRFQHCSLLTLWGAAATTTTKVLRTTHFEYNYAWTFLLLPHSPKTLWPHPPNLVPFIESFCLSFTIPQSLFQIPSIYKL